MVGYKKNIILALLIAISASSVHAQWQWLVSLKAFVAPLVQRVAEYPKLTAAFTLLSFGCIASIQHAFAQYHSLNATRNELKKAKEDHAKEKLGQIISKRESGNKEIDDQITQLNKAHAEYDKNIANKQKAINEYVPTQKQQTISSYSSGGSAGYSCAPRLSPIIENYIKFEKEKQSLEQTRNKLRCKLANKQLSLKLFPQSREFKQEADRNVTLAVAIKNKKWINIDMVLEQAKMLTIQEAPDMQGIEILRDKIIHMREQLASIKERAQKNAYEKLQKKYTNQARRLRYNNPQIKCSGYDNPQKIYHIMHMQSAAQGITSSDEIMTKIMNERIDRYPYLAYIFCGGKNYPLNPLAKENYDAFLLGKEALEKIAPTQAQYDEAQDYYNQLRTKQIKLNEALKQGARNVSKK